MSIRTIMVVGSAMVFSMVLSGTAFAIHPPEPSSGGKYTRGIGTMAEDDYFDPEAQGFKTSEGFPPGRAVRLGLAEFRPVAEYAAQYDSNIFLTEDGEEDDFIHKLRGGVDMRWPMAGAQHMILAGAQVEQEWFDEFDSQDHTDYRFQAGAGLNYVPFSLQVFDQYESTVDRADTEFTQRVERDENSFVALLEVPLAQMFFEMEFQDFNVDFESDALRRQDRHEILLFPRLGFNIGPETQLLGEFGYNAIMYDDAEDREGDAYQGAAGLRGRWTDFVTYEAWAGYQSRVYDQESRPDFHGVIARGGIYYDPTPLDRLEVRAHRNPVESTFDNQSFYVNNKAWGGWRRQIGDRTFANLHGYLEFNEYSRASTLFGQTETREDWVWGPALRLEHTLAYEKISFFGEYKYRGRSSNTATFDYTDHLVSVGARYLY